jgi:hypothetical protein
LEQEDGYLVAGARYAANNFELSADLVQNMIEQEARRSQKRSPHHK